MINAGFVEDFKDGLCSAFRIVDRPDNIRDSRQHDSTTAHGTRLFSDVENRMGDPPIAYSRCRLRNSEDLRMRRGILERLGHVVRFTYDLWHFIVGYGKFDNDASRWHFFCISAFSRFCKCHAHVFFMESGIKFLEGVGLHLTNDFAVERLWMRIRDANPDEVADGDVRLGFEDDNFVLRIPA